MARLTLYNPTGATIEIIPLSNQPPSVSAGPTQTVSEGTTVTLHGSATDPDGTITSVAWVQESGPAVTLLNANTFTPSFKAPETTDQAELKFKFTASDNGGRTVSDVTSVTVKDVPITGGNPPPILITPADSYAKIEAAGPGDTVLIAPGTYRFRLKLAKIGRADAPITIKAQDPLNPPVFDYSGAVVTTFPGSQGTGGDAYRSAWRVDGAYYVIDGPTIKGASSLPNGDNTAGIRYLNADHLTVKNAKLFNNNMGIQGGGKSTQVLNTEFGGNGVQGTDQSHNVYILGGDEFTMMFCYIHDCPSGQSFHSRATKTNILYNWMERAGDYEGDIMTGTTSYDPNYAGVMSLLFMGNTVVQKATPLNQLKLLTMYNDIANATPTMNASVRWNTFIFTDAGSNINHGSGVIQVGNSSMAQASLDFSNNLVAGVNPRLAYYLSAPTKGNVTITGSNNLMLPGSTSGVLTGSIFANALLDGNYRLGAGSPARGAANVSLSAPQYSFDKNGTVIARTKATDIGAFQAS